ncbi:hypothetical protein GCM10010269_53980 [Streptomyces humidus]|uniref:Uncharacterized protein n=1 Tax=Streptomyces humidus TaxID=52259 RepID=A0A918L5C9_9ACTN|nr:hypothetical protein GCM10010269_53980 [Streptomyces humidus]
MTPDPMTPDPMTPDVMTPDVMSPGCGALRPSAGWGRDQARDVEPGGPGPVRPPDRQNRIPGRTRTGS